MLENLKNKIGPEKIFDDADNLKTYGKDWTKHFSPSPLAIAFPKSSEDVKNIVQWAIENKVSLVPSGGRTGLSGAAIATNNELVVSFEKMNQIIEFNEIEQTVVCQPGVITEDLQNFALDNDLFYPVDFAARGSSQIGGNVATNAGGIKVLRYGLTRDWVAGLKVVTGKGDELHLNNSLIKNASGYDLRHLFIGSEGSLGFITEVTIRLTQKPKPLHVLLVGTDQLNHVMPIFSEFRKTNALTAFEMFTDVALSYVLKHTDLKAPLDSKPKYYLLAEIEELTESTLDSVMERLETCMEKEWVVDGILSQSPQQSKDLWRLREDISETNSMYEPYKNDVSVSLSHVPSFLSDMDEILKRKYPQIDVVWFGHIGDGNLHINMLKPNDMDSDKFLKLCQEADNELFSMIKKYKGSVSAEHGVGLVKKPWLEYTRTPEEILHMKEIKSSFDPYGLLNPGKIFDL